MIIKGPEDNFKEPKHRPSENDMLIPLRASVGASLKTALAKLTESTDEQGPSSGENYNIFFKKRLECHI